MQFPFIMQFHTSLKDSKNLYFLLEYIHGITLYNAIRELGKKLFLYFGYLGLLDRKAT